MAKRPEFGSPEMKSLFCLGKPPHNRAETTGFFNQGSFGIIPQVVMDERIENLKFVETNPDYYFIGEHYDLIDENLSRLCSFIKASKENVVFVPNATYATNCVLNSVPLSVDDEILSTDHVYGAVAKNIEAVCDVNGADILYIDMDYPVKNEDAVVDLFINTLTRNISVKMVILDHISSATAVKFPIYKITRAIKEKFPEIIVYVDGAHAPGQLPLNADKDFLESGIDYYCGNLHKWAFVSRSTGFLWIHPKHHDNIRPIITSFFYKQSLHDQFHYRGSLDYTPLLSVKTALNFYEDFLGGYDEISNYVSDLLDWAVDMLTETFQTSTLCIPKSMNAPFMRIIGLPEPLASKATKDGGMKVMDKFMLSTMKKYGANIKFTSYGGKLWIRLSANVTLNKQDFIRLKEIILKINQDEMK